MVFELCLIRAYAGLSSATLMNWFPIGTMSTTMIKRPAPVADYHPRLTPRRALCAGTLQEDDVEGRICHERCGPPRLCHRSGCDTPGNVAALSRVGLLLWSGCIASDTCGHLQSLSRDVLLSPAAQDRLQRRGLLA